MPNEDRRYYVLCEDNCRFEAMTKEQIIAAIAEATGETPTHIDDAFITKLKEKNKGAAIKMWVGTREEYNAIEIKESNVFYFVKDDGIIEQAIYAENAGTAENADYAGRSGISANAEKVNNIPFSYRGTGTNSGTILVDNFIVEQYLHLGSGSATVVTGQDKQEIIICDIPAFVWPYNQYFELFIDGVAYKVKQNKPFHHDGHTFRVNTISNPTTFAPTKFIIEAQKTTTQYEFEYELYLVRRD